ncbi:hypothetical protein L1987_57637 [Smallanthus sonchifolius]|uniref:Uncharacterized protein n=1 Tax=Smallanthus sonchifolius TaxID=185202 RepID=A0ACB9DD59_9ASTR|nr:hypothetical protein L1987_57637 [Smallanthus sonchifolius]
MAHIEHFEHLKILLEAIKSATNNFADDSCIGKGGFGKVYKGKIVCFNEHKMVALKRLDRAFGLCIDNKNVRHRSLIGLARQSFEQNKINEIVYGNIKDEINPDSLQVFATIAYQCLKRDREERPLMSDIVRALETALQYQCLKPPRAGSILQVNVLTAMEVKRRRAGILNVKVLEALNVRRSNPFAACNPYVILGLTHTNLPSMNKTTVKHKKSFPVWNEEFSMHVENIDVQSLLITVKSAQSSNQALEGLQFQSKKLKEKQAAVIRPQSIFIQLD